MRGGRNLGDRLVFCGPAEGTRDLVKKAGIKLPKKVLDCIYGNKY